MNSSSPASPKTKQEKRYAFLKTWQIIEMALIFAVSAPLVIMYAFSASKDIGFVLSILWKVFVFKAVILFFFIKKNQWVLILNIIQYAAVLLFLLYAVIYTFLYGNFDNLIAAILIIAFIIGVGVLYYIVLKKSYQYYIYLRKPRIDLENE